MSRFLQHLVQRSVAVQTGRPILPRIDFWTKAPSGQDTLAQPQEAAGPTRLPQDNALSPIPETVADMPRALSSSLPFKAAPSQATPHRADGVEQRRPLVPPVGSPIPGVTTEGPISSKNPWQPDRPQAAPRPDSSRIEPAAGPAAATERATLGQKTGETAVLKDFTGPARVEAAMSARSVVRPTQPAIPVAAAPRLSPGRPPDEEIATNLSTHLRPAPVRPPTPTPRAPTATAEPAPQVVQVHIGAVEVRARPTNSAASSPAPAPQRTMGLGFDEYLALRTYRTWRDR